jgi:hypothetical protein
MTEQSIATKSLTTRLIETIGEHSYYTHAEWWDRVAKEPEIVEEALIALANRRPGAEPIRDLGSWLASTVRKLIEVKKNGGVR